MLAKCPAAAFLQGELKKTWKKRKPGQTSQKASQEPNQTSQKASQEPNQTRQKASQKPVRSQAKPAEASQKQAESQLEAKPNQPESQKASQKASQKPSQASQGRSPCRNKGSCWAFCQTAYLGVIILPARSVLESFAGRGQMLDGRVPGASQVE